MDISRELNNIWFNVLIYFAAKKNKLLGKKKGISQSRRTYIRYLNTRQVWFIQDQ